MRLVFVGQRLKGDSRFTLLRFESGRWAYGEGWKVSISLHRKMFYWMRSYRNIRVTLLGLNINWRGV